MFQGVENLSDDDRSKYITRIKKKFAMDQSKDIILSYKMDTN